MIALTLISCMALLSGASAKVTVSSRAQPPNEAILGGQKYSKETLVNLNNKFPQDVRVDHHTGDIFFITASGDFFGGSGLSSFEPTFKAHVLKKGSKNYEDIQGIRQESKSIGIDQVHGAIYIGTERGLYKYDPKTTSAWNYGSLPQDIIAVAIGNNGSQIYYVEAAVEKTHKMAIDFSSHELIYDLKGAYGLTIDGKNNYYFTDFYIPYLLKSGTHNRVKITGEDEFFKVADYSVDKNGNVFAINDKGDLYSIEPNTARATKLGNVGVGGETTSLAVEHSGDLLIGYKHGISRLKRV